MCMSTPTKKSITNTKRLKEFPETTRSSSFRNGTVRQPVGLDGGISQRLMYICLLFCVLIAFCYIILGNYKFSCCALFVYFAASCYANSLWHRLDWWCSGLDDISLTTFHWQRPQKWKQKKMHSFVGGPLLLCSKCHCHCNYCYTSSHYGIIHGISYHLFPQLNEYGRPQNANQ